MYILYTFRLIFLISLSNDVPWLRQLIAGLSLRRLGVNYRPVHLRCVVERPALVTSSTPLAPGNTGDQHSDEVPLRLLWECRKRRFVWPPQLPVRILTGLPVSDLWLVLQNCGGLSREYFGGHDVTCIWPVVCGLNSVYVKVSAVYNITH